MHLTYIFTGVIKFVVCRIQNTCVPYKDYPELMLSTCEKPGKLETEFRHADLAPVRPKRLRNKTSLVDNDSDEWTIEDGLEEGTSHVVGNSKTSPILKRNDKELIHSNAVHEIGLSHPFGDNEIDNESKEIAITDLSVGDEVLVYGTHCLGKNEIGLLVRSFSQFIVFSYFFSKINVL